MATIGRAGRCDQRCFPVCFIISSTSQKHTENTSMAEMSGYSRPPPTNRPNFFVCMSWFFRSQPRFDDIRIIRRGAGQGDQTDRQQIANVFQAVGVQQDVGHEHFG